MYNLIGSTLPIFLALFTIPIYLDLIGAERYGILAIAWLLLGYFGVFDLGLGRATAQRIAAIGDGNPKETAYTFWTALAINSGIGFLGGAIMLPVVHVFFSSWVDVSSTLQQEVKGAVFWLIIAVPIATLNGVLTGALQGKSRFFELNIVSIVAAIVVQLLPLYVAATFGPDLRFLFPSVVAVRLMTLAALYLRCHVHVIRQYRPRVTTRLVKRLLRFGGWVTVSAFIGPIMVLSDRFAIGGMLGAQAVTFYTIPFQLAERTAIPAASLASALFPRFSISNSEDGSRLFQKAIEMLAIITLVPFVIGVFMLPTFLEWWINAEFASRAGLVGQTIFIGFWINGFARIPSAHLQASGHPHIVALCHLFELPIYLVGLYLGLNYAGIYGAAVAFSLRTTADGILLCYFSHYLGKTTAIISIPVAIAIAAFIAATLLPTGSLQWLTSGSIVLVAALVWSLQKAPRAFRR